MKLLIKGQCRNPLKLRLKFSESYRYHGTKTVRIGRSTKPVSCLRDFYSFFRFQDFTISTGIKILHSFFLKPRIEHCKSLDGLLEFHSHFLYIGFHKFYTWASSTDLKIPAQFADDGSNFRSFVSVFSLGVEFPMFLNIFFGFIGRLAFVFCGLLLAQYEGFQIKASNWLSRVSLCFFQVKRGSFFQL